MKKSKLLNIIAIVLLIIGSGLAIFGQGSEEGLGNFVLYSNMIVIVGLFILAASYFVKKKEV